MRDFKGKIIETEPTKQTKDDTSKWVCPECKGTDTTYSIKLIQTGRNDNFPRFIPQIKESCERCGRYRRFTPQGDILIKRFNDRLMQIILPAKGRDFYE